MKQNRAISAPDLGGKCCIVTGASAGLGRATALALARTGASLTLVCRDRSRGEKTVDEIRRETGNAAVNLMLADLSAQKSIRKLASDFLARGEPLDILVNNAGVFNLKRSVTEDNIETVFAVNHLSYFMLTLLLLARLKQSARARIAERRFGGAPFRHYRFRRSGRCAELPPDAYLRPLQARQHALHLRTCAPPRRYPRNRQLPPPGGVATGLGLNNGAIARLLARLIHPFLRSPEEGARTQVYLASSPDVEGIGGAYFVDCKPAKSSPESYDTSVARRLWETSARMTGTHA
jgi:hypothetical protein